MDVILIGILFDEFAPDTYRGIEVKSGEQVKVFFTGLPEEDYKAAREYAAAKGEMIMSLSSVDHFVMDGGEL